MGVAAIKSADRYRNGGEIGREAKRRPKNKKNKLNGSGVLVQLA